MKTLNIEIGQQITFDELCNSLELQAGDLEWMKADILKGDQTNIDNYDGEEGFNVYFDVIKGDKETFLYEFVVVVTDIDEI